MRIIKILGWPAAIAILLAVFVTELLPFAFGTKYNLKSDLLSLIYVVLHFIILPIFCLIHIFWNLLGSLIAIFVLRRPDLKWNTIDILSTGIPIAYMVILLLWPYPFLSLLA